MPLARYINTFFRHWPLYLLPALIIALSLVAFSLTLKPKYSTTATIWVEQSAFISDRLKATLADGSNWDSPATAKGKVFQEYLQLRSFIRDAVSTTSFKDLLKDPNQEADLIKDIQSNTSGNSNGYNSFTVKYSHASAKRSNEITRALIEQFFAYQMAEITRTGKDSIDLLQAQLKTAQQKKDQSDADLRAFLSKNPCSTTGSTGNQTLTESDLECQAILSQRDSATKDYNDTLASLQATQDAYNAALQGKVLTLRVADQPETSEASSSNKLTSVIFGVAGFFVGLFLSVIAVIAMTWTDNSLRLRAYAERLFTPTQVFELPYLKTPKARKLKGGQVIASPDVRQRMIAPLKWAQDDRNNSLQREGR